MTVMTFQSVFWSIVTGNRLQTFGNQLQDLKFKFQNPFEKLIWNLVFDNRLQYLVIDYQCLWVVENILFVAKTEPRVRFF